MPAERELRMFKLNSASFEKKNILSILSGHVDLE